MTTWLFQHEACLDHDTGGGHPESPARLRAISAALSVPQFAGLERRKAPRAERDLLLRVHPPDYIDRLLAAVTSNFQPSFD